MSNIKVIRPQKGPQEKFLSTTADIAIYGGAAGGGKSYGLLIEPLRYKNNKRFGAVIFRHEYKQIFNQGGLWDTSNDVYGDIKGADGRYSAGMAAIEKMVTQAVLYAQQVLTSKSGAEKKAIVTDLLKEMLTAKNISITDEQLNILIEAAVKQMKMEENAGIVIEAVDEQTTKTE